jgi:ubiquinone/menaquinone biosynthesis C-methylase UbiE
MNSSERSRPVQNIYDNAEFFEGYSRMRRSVEGLAGAAEWPAMRALLPALPGQRVLDLGCGFGWFCRWAREQGAEQVVGIDVSENMLARARGATSDAAITYQQTNMERIDLPEAAFDLVYSSLALHYVEDFSGLMAKVHRTLKPEGHLVFSIEHPVYMAAEHPEWMLDAKGSRVWPVNRYFTEGPRETDWLAKGVIKQHRTMGTTLNVLIDQGYRLMHVEEWQPTEEQIEMWADSAENRDRPIFLVVAAQR